MRVLCRRTNKEYTKYCLAYSLFQSPSSVWRTTAGGPEAGARRDISIHVLRVEDDKVALKIWRCRLHFNPRPPCGGRPASSSHAPAAARFQSTSSMWRTTRRMGIEVRREVISIRVLRVEDDEKIKRWMLLLLISIHVLRVEDDRFALPCAHPTTYFNPRPPCGGRPIGISSV